MASSAVTKGLLWTTIGANVYVWGKWHVIPDLAAAKQGPDSYAYRQAQAKHLKYMDENYTLSRKNMAEGRWWTLITSSFSHIGMTHLGINMFILRQYNLSVRPISRLSPPLPSPPPNACRESLCKHERRIIYLQQPSLTLWRQTMTCRIC